MLMNLWGLAILCLLIGLLLSLMIFFRKKKKTTPFFISLIIFFVLLAIFLHGVAFYMHLT
ncbi:TPA: hypothetical protein JBA21_03790 [Legionella pneumophila]|uniref:Transmembrane protein n=2 Tax=Legionella TaxID=445 RepID=A0A0W0TF21_LEGER|nr:MULTISPECIES: hypothetical protein [Legionella]KTC94204.1 hypothetical protein Lery_2371 [Legionella erythra]MDW8902059.1 hypothetical protein [Legionella pneumophila]MDW8907341.1 hypothetical protein [Legionella pneumophila]OCH97962.1 hypothetical protein A8135_01695 [Legionella jamestowniensis]TIG73584.1 hypothetical protein DI129_01370 [Legionella pneumophila]